MSEQELLQENERLRRELEAANKSRERLREIVCALLPVDPPEVMERQVQEMMQGAVYGIEDIIADLLQKEPDSPSANRSIPA
jgi:hypothetical protein